MKHGLRMVWNEGMVGGSNSLGVGNSTRTSVDESKGNLIVVF